MDFSVSVVTGPLLKIEADALVVPYFQEDKKIPPPIHDIDKALGGIITSLVNQKRYEGKTHQILSLPTFEKIGVKNIVLWGLGKKEDYFTQTGFQTLGSLGRFITKERFTSVVFPLLSAFNFTGESVVIGKKIAGEFQYALYKFQEYKSLDKEQINLKNLIFLIDSQTKLKSDKKVIEREAHEGIIISRAANYARSLGDTAPNDMTPRRLAAEAKKISKNYNLACTVFSLDKIKKLGMGAFYAVARGSREPAQMIILEYRGGKATEKPVALIGKGITFDTGGISIKPNDKMEEMKYDMCGGAAVLGTMRAAAELKFPCNLVGIVPATENMPDGNAYKPGDIVRSYSGQTIEVISTDAEGRMLLADCLTYTEEKYKPSAIIDLATLTGACVIALGVHASGLLGNDEQLLNEIQKAGIQSGERVWTLPLWKDYDKQLESIHADMQNVGGRPAGTITAAAFLKKFIKKGTPWAHLDIAGTAWVTDSLPYINKGATGVGVKLLIEFLRNRIKK